MLLNVSRSISSDSLLAERKFNKRSRNVTRLFAATEVCKTCCMDASEFVSHIEATLLRCASSKGHMQDDQFCEILEYPVLPTKYISRDVFTSIWIDSFI